MNTLDAFDPRNINRVATATLILISTGVIGAQSRPWSEPDLCTIDVVMHERKIIQIPDREPIVSSRDQVTDCDMWNSPIFTVHPSTDGEVGIELAGHYFALVTTREAVSCLESGADPNAQYTPGFVAPLHFCCIL